MVKLSSQSKVAGFHIIPREICEYHHFLYRENREPGYPLRMLSVQSISHAPSTVPKPAPKTFPYVEVALRALTELAISLALAAVCAAFTATPIILWQALAVQWLANTALRIALAISQRPLANWTTALNIAIGSLFNPQILTHEAGHFLAYQALLDKSNPTICLDSFAGGFTKILVSKPSALGHKVGAHRIQAIGAAAGPALSLASSAVQLKIGLKIYGRSPELARVLICASLINFLYHAQYALSALWTNPRNLCHDFVMLSTIGLHPLLATIAILAIPLLIAWRETPPHLKSERPALLPCRI